MCRHKCSISSSNLSAFISIGLQCRLGLSSIIFLSFQSPLLAQDTYTSNQAGRWNQDATWSGPAGTPDANDTAIIQNVCFGSPLTVLLIQ